MKSEKLRQKTNKHIAIFSPGMGEKILSGEKTVESRFSKSKVPPYSEVSVGDIIYIKVSGKDIIGQFRVKKVICFEGLTLEDVKAIREQYGDQILADENFWSTHQEAKYGTLIFIGECIPLITSPITFPKRDLRGWVTLE